MYTVEDFRSDCLALFNETEGNIVDVPGTGETVLFEEPIIGFASADDEIFETFTRTASGRRDTPHTPADSGLLGCREASSLR